MASIEVKLPDIGEGVNEGEIVRWLVKEGDTIKHDQPLLEVMTDKATVEIPSSADGKVTKLIAKEGAVVKVGGPLLSLDTAGGGASAGAEKAPAKGASQNGNGSRVPNGGSAFTEGTGKAAPEKASAVQAASTASRDAQAMGFQSSYQASSMSPPAAGADVMATPAVRRYARELGIDLNQVQGSGPVGRITREDVSRIGGGAGGLGGVYGSGNGHGTHGGPVPATQTTNLGMPSRSSMQAPAAILPRPQTALVGQHIPDERKPFRGIRKKIAENLVRSKQIIPHFTHVDEADATRLVEWRSRMKEKAEQYGVKLTYLPFIMKAVAATCREFPTFNASIDDAAGEIVIKHQFNIGFAADTPEGLLVPVVKNVEQKNILDIAHDIVTLAEKARAGKLAPDDMRGGSITITNIGSIGGIYATPIINHPEVAIIGIYSIIKKPVVIDDEIQIRDMMNLTATCDHRLIDGALAARFLKRLKDRIENPESLLLEMI